MHLNLGVKFKNTTGTGHVLVPVFFWLISLLVIKLPGMLAVIAQQKSRAAAIFQTGIVMRS